MQINPNLIPEDYSDQYLNTGSVVIRDFLTDESASELYNFFVEGGMPENWWYATSFPGLDGLKRFSECCLSKTI